MLDNVVVFSFTYLTF